MNKIKECLTYMEETLIQPIIMEKNYKLVGSDEYSAVLSLMSSTSRKTACKDSLLGHGITHLVNDGIVYILDPQGEYREILNKMERIKTSVFD